MNSILFIGISIVVAILLIVLVLYYLEHVLTTELKDSKLPAAYAYDLNEQRIYVRQIRKVITIIISIIVAGGVVYWLVKNTPMQGFVMEWLNLLIRWTHVVVGIMWIGASFYFIFLENNLNRTDGVRDELAGNLWAIHGGGFYFLEKYKIAPKQLPKTLHWFKYEAYFTWLSGFTLLIVVYYLDAKAFLIDKQVADIDSTTAIFIGIATLVIGWIIYDQMCKSRLVKNNLAFAVVGFIILAGFAYFLTNVFSSRAAYIHVGALIGTLMAWNVYFVIIPSQKALVKAAILGLPLDPTLGKKAGERSLHNNYFTLPVIFIMISNHFPSTFGHQYNWLILLGITLASAGIKHFWNLYERGVKTKYILPVSIIALLSLAMVTSPLMENTEVSEEKVQFVEVQLIFEKRCLQCHSSTPTDDQWTTAPNGVMYDTPEQIVNMADKIMLRAVLTNSMPQGNKTSMTDEERETIRQWILQGTNTTIE